MTTTDNTTSYPQARKHIATTTARKPIRGGPLKAHWLADMSAVIDLLSPDILAPPAPFRTPSPARGRGRRPHRGTLRYAPSYPNPAWTGPAHAVTPRRMHPATTACTTPAIRIAAACNAHDHPVPPRRSSRPNRCPARRCATAPPSLV